MQLRVRVSRDEDGMLVVGHEEMILTLRCSWPKPIKNEAFRRFFKEIAETSGFRTTLLSSPKPAI